MVNAQPTIRRLKEFGIRPKRDLGQNFLIDNNILGVIAAEADLQPDDIVLEVGGGVGILSEYLVPRVHHTHVVEIDETLEPALTDALAPYPGKSTLHFADAVRMRLDVLDPAPTKVVANLPYGIAATLIIRVCHELPSVHRQVGMVQREVGERFAASPGTPAYGAPSVLAQLTGEMRVLRAVPRKVFHPVPNVDSVLVGFTRTAPPPPKRVVALVQAGFKHRRKTLPGALAMDSRFGKAVRDAVRAALVEMGHPEDARAERLAPQDWIRLHEALEAS
jgi:16S rRNA (adenine1518-N6/adenine1519-N6)-dimethyltransferase